MKKRCYDKVYNAHKKWALFVMAFFMFITILSPAYVTPASAIEVVSGSAITGQAVYSEALGSLRSYKDRPVITGYFSFRGASSIKDQRERFFYSDGYFSDPATVYDEHLATMSMCLAGSAMSSYDGAAIDYPTKSCNVRELLDRIGCTDVCVNADFMVKPGEDTIGVCLGRKKIEVNGEEFTLIPIGIRGAGYEKEWIGNMKVGSEGDALGFRKACDRAKETVDAYLKKYNIDSTKTKFWIAGFSRAGAVTDLLTAALTDAYDPTGANVYGYSFATPQGAYNKSRSYPNSHCTINSSDAVPMVVPSYMGFSHYGDDVLIEDRSEEFKSYRMGVDYAVDVGGFKVPQDIHFSETDKYPTQRAYLEELMNAIQGAVAPDRQAFSTQKVEGGDTVEQILAKLMKFLMTSESEHVAEVADAVSGFKDRLGFDGLLKLSEMVDAVKEGINTLDKEKRDEIYAATWIWFKPGFESSLSKEEFENLGKMWESMVYVVFEIAHYDYVHSGREGFALIGTMMKNLALIGDAHNPEKYLTMVKQRDNFYMNEVGNPVARTDEVFRIGESGDVNAVVYSEGKPVAVINAGRTGAAHDGSVCTLRLSDKGSELKETGDGILYTNPASDNERAITMAPDRDYKVVLIAGDRGEDVEFQKWTDESGKELSQSETFEISVDHGKASYTLIKPVYRTVPKPTPVPPTPVPENQPNQNPRGIPGWIWIVAGGVLAGGGAGGALYARKRIRKKNNG